VGCQAVFQIYVLLSSFIYGRIASMSDPGKNLDRYRLDQDGSHDIRIAVAGIGLALRGDGAHHTVLRRNRYKPFLADAPLMATVEMSPVVDASEIEWDESLTGPVVALDGAALSYRIYGGEGYLDGETGKGWLRCVTDEAIAHGALANFLRVAYAVLLVRHGGFLFHSAGMIRDGRGYLFYGHSGSGKSTISGLSKHLVTLLSDDLVAVRIHDGVWRVHGTPFWGELEGHPRTNASAPLRGLFSLVKSHEVKLDPLPPSQAVADVVSSVPVTCTEPHISAQLIELCADLAAKVPCYRLHFSLDDSFWRVIDELA
jgi:hypothetical protein